ncbi:MAG: UDP-galactopyranose mutase [Candidatus Levybacteria bacterium]|nr:UDP-galactopyranose mutase [Candidatus Levybacteria bacterium]
MKKVDFLIVGAGFSGAVLAERLNCAGYKVLVIDKRKHIGGNCYDYYHKSGVLVHKYGPHYFRTDCEEVKKYLSQFTGWIKREYKIRVFINGRLYTFPINRNTLNEFFGLNLKNQIETKKFLDSIRVKIKNPKNAEEQMLSSVGKELYEAFFKNYTKKQWGIDPKKLDPAVTARIPIRTNSDDRCVNEKFQAIPKDGYAKLFEKILSGIDIMLNTDFKKIKDKIKYKKLIYTGPIDEFFNYKFGKLPYRSLKFKLETFEREFYQDYAQINYPNNYKFTRITEIKHVTAQKIPRTTIVKEYPLSIGQPYYPIPASQNQALYLKYRKEADKLKNVYFTGRLAEYKYLNMDQVVKNSLELFQKIVLEQKLKSGFC